jgi:hypothetical protein
MISIVTKSFSKDLTVFSNEEQAAIDLKELLQNELMRYPNTKGTIYVLSSIHLFGQRRNDIDILVIGLFDGFVIRNAKTKNYDVVNELNIKSFIFNIELKSHPSSRVHHEGTDYIVYYKGVPHNASQQCQEAKFSLFNHLYDQLNLKPFICDVLWFNGLTQYDLISMRGSYIDNALHRDFLLRDLFNVILAQSEVKQEAPGVFSLDCFNGGEREYQEIVNLFTEVRKPQGLTKAKFELISQKSTEVEKLVQDVGKKLTIITGRAGTGKTVQLLQLAFILADENNANRCLILTYNHALVSDIQRIIDYTPMPSRADGRTVSIKTIHSFFHSLMKEVGLSTDHLCPNKSTYDYDYNESLKELYEFVVNECREEDIETLKDMAESPIDWDYILIDEAQDFSEIEKKILFKVYGVKRLVVADGVDQFMRTGFRQIWERGIEKSLVRKPKTMELERRQKANIVSFVNAFARLANIDWKVYPNSTLAGGEIKIYPEFSYKIFKELKQNCERNGCENYDILILEPPSQVIIDAQGNRFFSKADIYIKKAGIPIFDGINSHNRTTYPTKDQCRIYQYDSCRGLEGWCVVCADFDELIEYKKNTYNTDDGVLGLDREQAKKRSVYLWSLMPLTRPIDTLIITIKDQNSEVGMMLKQLSDAFPDFVEWNL